MDMLSDTMGNLQATEMLGSAVSIKGVPGNMPKRQERVHTGRSQKVRPTWVIARLLVPLGLFQMYAC